MSTLESTAVIFSDLKAAREVEEKVLCEVAACGYSEASCFAIKLAIEESLNNAIRHGNGYDSNKRVRVGCQIDPQRVCIIVADEGDGFDPASVPDPTANENLEKPHGRGIMLMQAYMDEVHFNKKGNEVRLIKRNN
ncbi:MAG: ATP-binding protein [Planctomycetota bacterium]|nr:ATP-binding protein [Planctomycetota bacterium]